MASGIKIQKTATKTVKRELLNGKVNIKIFLNEYALFLASFLACNPNIRLLGLSLNITKELEVIISP